MYTPKERLIRVFEKQKVDRPPCICPGGMMNMVTTELVELMGISFDKAHSDPEKMALLSEAVYKEGCFENYGVPFCMTIEAEDMGAKVDMGSDIYEPHVTEYSIDSVVQWKTLGDIELSKGRGQVVLDAIRILKSKGDDVPVIGNITGPISTASSVMEPSIFYKELRKKNQEAHEFMEFVTDQLIVFAKAQIEAGADVIAISDPSGTGEILGPKLFEEFAVKYLNKLVDSIKSENVKTIVHICGQMRKVYEKVDLIHSDALSFDAIVSMSEARSNLSDRVLMGNVSTYTIEFGESEKIVGLMNKCIIDGSDIISPACGLGMKSPLKNVRAMLDSLNKEV